MIRYSQNFKDIVSLRKVCFELQKQKTYGIIINGCSCVKNQKNRKKTDSSTTQTIIQKKGEHLTAKNHKNKVKKTASTKRNERPQSFDKNTGKRNEYGKKQKQRHRTKTSHRFSKQDAEYKKQYPSGTLVVRDDFVKAPTFALSETQLLSNISSEQKEGDILTLVDRHGNLVAYAYYGLQKDKVAWTVGKRTTELDITFFQRKFSNAFDKRRAFLATKKTTVFRLFNAEGDGIGGITIDYYDNHFLINYYNRGIYAHRDAIRKAVQKTAFPDTIVEKKRFGDTQDGTIVFHNNKHNDEATETVADFAVLENGISCRANLLNGGMTGLFADQREVRKYIRNNLAKGKNVLNLFSYTALFSVSAALGGAKSTTNVDLAKRSHELAKRNFKQNHIPLENHYFHTDDVFRFIHSKARKGVKYDLIIIDPPSFSTSSTGVFSSERDIEKLIKGALSISTSNATFILSTNNAKIKREKFRHTVEKHLTTIREFSLPEDYRTPHGEEGYLKVIIAKRQ